MNGAANVYKCPRRIKNAPKAFIFQAMKATGLFNTCRIMAFTSKTHMAQVGRYRLPLQQNIPEHKLMVFPQTALEGHCPTQAQRMSKKSELYRGTGYCLCLRCLSNMRPASHSDTPQHSSCSSANRLTRPSPWQPSPRPCSLATHLHPSSSPVTKHVTSCAPVA